MFAITFPIDFGALVNIAFNIKVKIVQVIEWPYRSSHIMFTITSTLINKFWTYNSIPLQHMSFWCPLLNPHPPYHRSKKGVCLTWDLELDTRTSCIAVMWTILTTKQVGDGDMVFNHLWAGRVKGCNIMRWDFNLCQ